MRKRRVKETKQNKQKINSELGVQQKFQENEQ